MVNRGKKFNYYAFIAFKFCAVCLFTGGFIYQTMEFLFLYWTYPTVVDIQESSPTFLEVPAFTFCNRVGYHFDNLCTNFGKSHCINTDKNIPRTLSNIICSHYPAACNNGSLPNDFKVILYGKFMKDNSIKQTDIPILAVPLEEYLICTIEFAGKITPCNMDSVLGSFYATEDLPQFCYTIYSKWGNPNKERDRIPKGAIMKFVLFMNVTRRDQPPEALETGKFLPPLYNPPTDMAVQIAVHSPYFLPSPYLDGSSFLAARAYDMRIKLSESHLLPAPYQTNCTDYMRTWYDRGGKAPIDQLTSIQECRINVTYQTLGCIPVTMDYPHNYDLCKVCDANDGDCKWKEPPNNCTLLAESYSQPCDSMMYNVVKENKVITVFEKANSAWAQADDGLRHTMTEYNCTGLKMFSQECSTITIDVPFDRFKITNITYNAKFESLELFSVVGGYMGMWLGISFLTVFDLISDSVVQIRQYLHNRKWKHLEDRKVKIDPVRRLLMKNKKCQTVSFNVW